MSKEKILYRYINESDLNGYEKENKRLSYYNLFYSEENLMLCNPIAEDFENLEPYSGCDYDEEDYYIEIYQYYLINESTANRLADIGEITYYHNKLDLYVLGVTHCGTSWTYVLTDLILEDLGNGKYGAYYFKESEEK